MAKVKTKKKGNAVSFEMKKKFGKNTASLGFSQIPFALFEMQGQLEISSAQMMVLLNIIKHWWYEDSLPFPSVKSIADCTGTSRSNVQKHLAALERMGYIKRIERKNQIGKQTSNEFNFDGLLKKMDVYSKEMLVLRKKQQKEREKMLQKEHLRGHYE